MAEKKGFTAEEKAAMRARAKELKRRRTERPPCVLRSRRCRRRTAPWRSGSTSSSRPPLRSLTPKTWYGMPAYAKDGKVVVFFRNAGKFKERYGMLGFNDSAKLDDGSMWPIAFAVTKLTAADEKKITTLVKKAAG